MVHERNRPIRRRTTRLLAPVLQRWGKGHQLQAVEVFGHASVEADGVEVEPLIGLGCPADQAVPVVDAGADLFPDSVREPEPNSRPRRPRLESPGARLRVGHAGGVVRC